MAKVNVRFDLYEYEVSKGKTILEASLETHTHPQEYKRVMIPVLYYLKGINDTDESGVCVVEADGELVNASTTRIREGMNIQTRSEKVIAARREALAKILAKHNKSCIYCDRSSSCELQDLLHEYGFTNEPDLPKEQIEPLDLSSKVLVRDNNKCIRCKRCIAVCGKVQAVSAIAATGNGLDTVIAPSSPQGLAAASCVNCGQCVAVCPVGALTERTQMDEVKAAIADPEKYVVVQVAPAVRAALGEDFEFPIGVDVEGRIAGALKELGFDKVFDTKVGADLTIMEEAHELEERIKNEDVLPMITSCCPGWIKYAEHFYPDMLDHISSCKSPHLMFGAIVKSYYAEKRGLEKDKIVTVSVMPCTAKKFEITREQESGTDVDYVITTNELSRMIKDAEIQFESMSVNETFDEPLGEGTGAAVIFGARGGGMEAALRTAVEDLTGESLQKLEFADVRGMNGIKEASYELNGQTLKVAVVSGLANANALLTRIKAGEADYQFIEVMACPGGCVNGGGQPHQPALLHADMDIPAVRAAALYRNDEASAVRKSHENEAVKELYRAYLGEPGSEVAHKLLHTTYMAR